MRIVFKEESDTLMRNSVERASQAAFNYRRGLARYLEVDADAVRDDLVCNYFRAMYEWFVRKGVRHA